LKRDGRLVLSVGMISAASPGRMPVPVFLQGYCPVINAYREGVQLAEVACPLVNRIPLLGKPVHVGRFYFCGPVATKVSIAKIIRINDDHIRALLGGEANAKTEESAKGLKTFHAGSFVL